MGDFVLNEEQWEWVDKDDEEPLSCTCTPGIFLKGYPLRLCLKGGMCWHHLQGVKLCFSIASQGGFCSHQRRATVWASHLQLINSHTLILTADHN